MTGMIRPAWHGDDEQLKLLNAAVKAAREADTQVDAGWAAILRARKAGVPDKVLCDRTGWSRATLNRKFGPRSDT